MQVDQAGRRLRCRRQSEACDSIRVNREDIDLRRRRELRVQRFIRRAQFLKPGIRGGQIPDRGPLRSADERAVGAIMRV